MNILVVNDDGINERGLKILADTLAKIPDTKIYVVAPDSQRTATSMSITIFKTLRLSKIDSGRFERVEEAYSCSGFPADCSRMGIKMLRKRGINIDLVCSGINHGSNLGRDTLYSGTVSACREAVLNGVPAIAFSVCSHHPSHFEAFEKLIPNVLENVYGKVDPKIITNVNVPDVPVEELKGTVVTHTGSRRYEEHFKLLEETDYYVDIAIDARKFDEWDMNNDDDVTWVFKNYVAVTPLQVVISTDEGFEQLDAIDFKYE